MNNPQSEELIHFSRLALGLSETASIAMTPLSKRGSNRSFYRMRWGEKDSSILIHYNPGYAENACYAEIALFLHDTQIPVPRLVHHDPSRCLILMEDLGDTDLWSFRKVPWDSRRGLYRETLVTMQRLHTFPLRDFPSDRVKLMEPFDPDLYRWERDYFQDYFVKNICRIELEPSFKDELEAELAGLAERLTAAGRSLVHRDFQSQNVMIRNETPFLIDFQGMRFGCPFYDLGSLLCDPYVNFSKEEQQELLSFYYKLGTMDRDWPAFQQVFHEASAQRLMQALGAYGFLGLKKGLKAFLEHIPAGLRHLQYAVGQANSLPRLVELSARCQKAIG